MHMTPADELDKMGYVNQHGLSRKVGTPLVRLLPRRIFMTFAFIAHF